MSDIPENPMRAAVALLKQQDLGPEGKLFMEAVDHALAERDDLRRRLASAEAQLVAMTAALRLARPYVADAALAPHGAIRSTADRLLKVIDAALAQPHSTEALRELGSRLVYAAFKVDVDTRAEFDAVFDAVLKGTR